MKIAGLCERNVRQADGTVSIQDAAAAMKHENVGTLVVLDAQGRIEGLVTDRDLVVRALSEGRDPARTRVADVMTRNPRMISADAPIEEALALMHSLGVRRIPVVGPKGALFGVLSVDDVVGRVAADLGYLAGILAHSNPGTSALTLVPKARVRDFAGLERAKSDPEC
jgi:signal-transduction protein with cAMP-binding, CBS, and nucleotidyltransferase domain